MEKLVKNRTVSRPKQVQEYIHETGQIFTRAALFTVNEIMEPRLKEQKVEMLKYIDERFTAKQKDNDKTFSIRIKVIGLILAVCLGVIGTVVKLISL